MEHGAVWITHRPDLPTDQVQRLAERVRSREYMLLSPAEGLDAPISCRRGVTGSPSPRQTTSASTTSFA
jgi:hypothetical protein